MGTVRKQPNDSISQNNSLGEFGSAISRASGSRDADSANDAAAQAGGSCGTCKVCNVKNESVSAGKGNLPAVTSMLVSGSMVEKVKRARKRGFGVHRIRESRGVRAWRSTSPKVITQLLAFTQCVSVFADVQLQRKSSLHMRSELRSRLARALARGCKEKAFAKSCGFSDKPLANDPEAMMRAYPGLHHIKYDVPPVQSGINVALWQLWHARHCAHCTPDKIHDNCYFKPLIHFLRAGFELPVRQGTDIFSARPSRVAYVDKWREEEARCRTAFKKWENDSSGLMSPSVAAIPKLSLIHI